MKFRHTLTIVIDGPEKLVRTLSEQVLVAASLKINDTSHGNVRWRLQAQADWLDSDGNVIPLDQVVAAAKLEKGK